MAELGLDFIDLTLEPPCVASWQVAPAQMREQLVASGFATVVGHTAYFLPIGSSFRTLRQTAIDELRRCVDVFAAIGARWMDVHPDAHAPFYEEAPIVERNTRRRKSLSASRPGWRMRICTTAAVATADLHLALGMGNMDVARYVRAVAAERLRRDDRARSFFGAPAFPRTQPGPTAEMVGRGGGGLRIDLHVARATGVDHREMLKKRAANQRAVLLSSCR
jgi:hypothetical protein